MKRTVFVILAVLLSTAFGRVWYVHPDSTQNSIQPCLNTCGAGDTVLVAAGTYRENIDWPNTQGIELLSESGPDATVIYGDSSRAVVNVHVAVDTMTVLEGFTIRGGCASAARPRGGGISIVDGGPMVRNNIITGNYGKWGGGLGAVYAESVYVVGNRFMGNAGQWGGAMLIDSSTAFIKWNRIARNWTDPAAIVYVERLRGLIEGNTFSGNHASQYCGLGCLYETDAPVRNNVFEDETADVYSAGVYFSGGPTSELSGNVIRRCRAPMYAGIMCAWANPTIINDTFVDNTTGTSARGIVSFFNGSSASVRGCYFSGNTQEAFAGAVMVEDSSLAWVDSCRFVNNGTAGVYFCYDAGGTVHNCDISDNFMYGVYCENVDDSIDVRYNWWGDSTGPFHPDSNPGGLGDTVSLGVRFRPWLTNPVYGLAEEEMLPAARSARAVPFQTLVNGAISLPPRLTAVLLDISGRRVMTLQSGPNDVRHLVPGVYFARRATGEGRVANSKVIVTR